MAVQTKQTVFAITKEVTEGTPVFPTGATEYTAFQEGFTVTPSFATLDSTELQASIGKTKSTLGFEEPTASVVHYLRHSGVEGTEPDFKILLENALGAKQVNATERLTAAASTTSLVKLASGGSDFTRGMGLLVKNSVDGYEVRNVSSIATNDLSLAQNLNNAPAAGVGVGKAVHYKVVDSGHPTLSLFTYRGNGGALELLTGGRVSAFSLEANAGEFINASFTIDGINYKFDPIQITSSTRYIDFVDSVGTQVATVEAKTYKDPYELAEAIETAMNGASTDTITCTYNDGVRKFTVASNGTTFSLLFATGANTANTIATKIGFTVADETAALTYSSDNAISFASPFVPTYDTTNNLVAKNQQVMMGLSTDVSCFDTSTVTINVANTKTDILSICAESGKSGSIISAREVTATVSGYLSVGQAEEFKHYRKNDTIVFTFNAGEKSGGNWVPGTVVNAHLPTARISEFALTDSDGIVKLDMSIQAFVESGKGEFFLTLL